MFALPRYTKELAYAPLHSFIFLLSTDGGLFCTSRHGCSRFTVELSCSGVLVRCDTLRGDRPPLVTPLVIPPEIPLCGNTFWNLPSPTCRTPPPRDYSTLISSLTLNTSGKFSRSPSPRPMLARLAGEAFDRKVDPGDWVVDFKGRLDRGEVTPSSIDRDRGGGRQGNNPPCPPDLLGIAYLDDFINFQRNRLAPSRCRPPGRFTIESPHLAVVVVAIFGFRFCCSLGIPSRALTSQALQQLKYPSVLCKRKVTRRRHCSYL